MLIKTEVNKKIILFSTDGAIIYSATHYTDVEIYIGINTSSYRIGCYRNEMIARHVIEKIFEVEKNGEKTFEMPGYEYNIKPESEV